MPRTSRRTFLEGLAGVGAHWCAGTRCAGRNEQFNDDVEAFYAGNRGKVLKGEFK